MGFLEKEKDTRQERFAASVNPCFGAGSAKMKKKRQGGGRRLVHWEKTSLPKGKREEKKGKGKAKIFAQTA